GRRPRRAPRAPRRLRDRRPAAARPAPGGARRPARSVRGVPRGRLRGAARRRAGGSLNRVTAVLFTCAGQRVDIVTAFGRAGAFTVAADSGALAPALYCADRYALVPRVDADGYVPALQRLVEEHGISLVVPLTDLDQLLLARCRDELGATVLLPSPEVVEAMGDKYLAH